MPLDPSCLGAQSEPRPVSWQARDCVLYALGVGAGPGELAFATDDTRNVPQRMLPTMPVTLGVNLGVLKAAGPIDWMKLVHAEQRLELFDELPVAGEAMATSRIAELWDKESAAVVVVDTEARGVHDDRALFRSRASLFIRGAGGWGGERGPSASTDTPPGNPEFTVSYPTSDNQALIYRLSGDRNPLHSDPAFAARAGFAQPILHGLCTFGVAGRAVLRAAAGGEPSRIESIQARFAASVHPGQTLHVDLWPDGNSVRFTTRTDEAIVLSHGRARIRPASDHIAS
jgi:acyl dehydratase